MYLQVVSFATAYSCGTKKCHKDKNFHFKEMFEKFNFEVFKTKKYYNRIIIETNTYTHLME